MGNSSLSINKMSKIPSSPLVSVVMPTYKRPELIKRSIGSVVSQTYSNWELIVSDDEPEKGETWVYVTELAKNDTRIRIVRNDGPKGQVGNTNNGIVNAKGEWVKLLHDDDLLKPNCLEDLVEVSAITEEIACITCAVERYTDGIKTGSYIRSGWPLLEILEQDQIHLTMYLQEKCWWSDALSKNDPSKGI